MKLYKTEIVIWSDYDPAGVELDRLALEATTGDSYCSRCDTTIVDDPTTDPFPPSMEFFGDVDEEE